MKRLIYILFLSVFLFGNLATLIAQTTEEKPPILEIDGFVRNYTGVLVNNGDFSIVQNTLDLTLKHQREKISFVANPFVYQYAYQENYFDIRELYMDFYSDKVDVRIGKQQIIWGQADGVFITDIVSPKNLTEFLLWDFNEIRMGVTALKLNYYPKPDHDLEFVWIPTFTPTIAPENGSIWKPKAGFPAPPIFDFSQKDIKPSLQNSEFFARYTLSKSAIDLQIIGGYTWDDDPSLHINKQFGIDPITNQAVLTNLLIAPKHHRLVLGGASFSTEIKGFILRGEGAFYYDKHFQTKKPTATDALTQKNYINYVAGVDKTIGDWKISGQFIQKVILEYDENIKNDEVDNLATIMINRTLMREKVRLELFSYVGLNNADAFIRFRAYYFPVDGVGIELGTNIFIGDKGMFGQYDKNDMVYARVKYSF